MSALLYQEVIHVVLLFGADSLVLSDIMKRKVGSTHVEFLL